MRRLALHLERLEDRFLMDGAGFVNTDPPEDPDSIVGVAGIEAVDDYVKAGKETQQLRIDVLSNDPLPEGSESLRIKSVSKTARGATVSISDDGKRINYQPSESGIAFDSFYYIVEDDNGKLGKANVSVGIKSHGNGSTSHGSSWGNTGYDVYEIFEDSKEREIDVLRNDNLGTDRDFRDGEIFEVTTPSRGTVRIAEDGKSLFYQPNFGESGTDPIRYTVRNEEGNTASVSVSIRILKPYEIVRDGDRGFRWLFMRDVDTGPHHLRLLANDKLRAPVSVQPEIIATSLPKHVGELRISEDGQSVIYEPAANFLGRFTYSYTVRYGEFEHQTTSAHGYFTVRNTFLAVDNWFTVQPDSETTRLNVLKNDPTFLLRSKYTTREVTLKITDATPGNQSGQIAISEDGKSLRYQPAPGFTGEETFSYIVEDSNGHRDTANVTVHVVDSIVDPSGVPKFTLPGELEQFLIDQAVEKYQNEFGVSRFQYIPIPVNSRFHTFNDTDESLAFSATNAAGDYSETNTQETGIDEADIVETDGRYLYTFSSGQLVIVDLIDPTDPQLVSFTEFDSQFDEMYLQGDRLTLLRRGSLSQSSWQYHHQWWQQNSVVKAELLVLDLSDRAAPAVVERTEIDGRIVDSRAVGNRVYVVVSSNTLPPIESVVVEAADLDESRELRVNETLDQYVARLRAQLNEIALPTYETFGPDGELLRSGVLTDATNIHQPLDAADNALLSLVTFDAGDDLVGPLSSTGIFTNEATEIYMSGDSIYALRNHAGDTAIFKFDVAEDGSSALVATGTVDGWLLNQFSVDEHDDRLRIATTQMIQESYLDGNGNKRFRQARRFNNLFVLEQNGAKLEVVGSVENLAPTETIFSVRFLDDQAYVVTFRVVDPLFTIDLSDPTNPTVEGALKIPGFSNYLHPVGEDYVLGIGRDADEITGQLGALQISLFYVGDLANPTLVDQVTFEGARWANSEAWNDHHAVAYFAEDQVLTIPVSWTETIDTRDNEAWNYFENYEHHSAIWAFQIDTDGLGEGSIETTGHVEHATETTGNYFRQTNGARRSIRIGDALVTISNDYVKVNDLHEVGTQLGEVYLGKLPEADRFTVQEDSTENPLDVRANDHPGADGEAPLIVNVTQPTRSHSIWAYGQQPETETVGHIEIAENGESLIFTPDENFFGTASFTYTIIDALRGEQQATVTVTVENVPDDPEAVDDEVKVDPDSQSVVLNVLANDIDVDAPVFTNVSWFNAHTIDDRATLNSATVSDTLQLSQATTQDFVSADSDYILWRPSRLLLTAVGSTDQGGTVEIDSTGQHLIYTPATEFEGIETFTYTITTSAGRTDVATVTVQVGEVARPNYRPATRTLRPENNTASSAVTQARPTIKTRTLPAVATATKISPPRVVVPARKAFTERPASTSLNLQPESTTSSEKVDREVAMSRNSFVASGRSRYRVPAQPALSPSTVDVALQDAAVESLSFTLQVELTDELAIDLAKSLSQ